MLEFLWVLVYLVNEHTFFPIAGFVLDEKYQLNAGINQGKI